MADFDALIIGGGLGGLSCGIALARAGRKVCVLESGQVVGGYAANFVRGPYRFDASLHMLDAVEPGCPNRPVWEQLGLHERVPTVAPPLLRREFWPHHDLSIPQGIDAWVGALAEVFPAERDGLQRVANLAVQVHAAVMADRDARLAGTAPPPLSSPMAELLDVTAGPVLRRHLSEPQLISIAGSLSCYLGLGCDELAAIPFFTMLASYHRYSGSCPVGGSGAIAAALADELQAAGGEVRLGSAVAGISCERRAVRGVTLETGERLDAPIVVSNISPLDTYQRLLAVGQVDRRFNNRLARMRLGTSVVKVWIGLPRPVRDDLPYESFLRTKYGTTFCDGTLEDIGVVAPANLDPTCAPAGGAVISITAGAEATLADADQDRYAALADEAVRQVDQRLIPGLIDDAEVRVTATPRTFHAYTRNPGGTIHGFRPIPSQSGPRRLGVTGPIGGLYHVGGWTYAGSGFLPAMTSGLIAAATIEGGLD